ncbi:MAG: hypothetical protein ACI976_001390, partial [Aureispira sp.]
MINMFKNQRIFYWSCFLFLCFASSLSAQTGPEICGNGLDDDLDGLIDCYDPDCCADASCAGTFYDACDVTSTCFEGVIPTTFSIRRSKVSDPAIPIFEAGIPFVGDFDGDGIAEYVATNSTGAVHVFRDGPAGLTASARLYGTLPGSATVNGLTLPNVVPIASTFITDPYLAIGDLDGDGSAEIIVRQPFSIPVTVNNVTTQEDHYHLCVYDGGGNLLAFYDLDDAASPFVYNNVGGVNRTGTTGVYDFDGDGIAEISHGLGIFRYDPSTTTGSRLTILGYPGTVVGIGLNNTYYGEQVVAVEVDNHTATGYTYGLELIAGNTVYDVNTSLA